MADTIPELDDYISRNPDKGVIGIQKGKHHYLFIYDRLTIHRIYEFLGKFASRKDLDFNWYDAELLRRRVSEIEKSLGTTIPNYHCLEDPTDG